MTAVRVGTCSWADESLSKLWYPAGVRSAEGRLRYYAESFDVVEVNSSYYALPTAEAASQWAARTPDGFTFHVKAFGMMTRHPVRAEQLPPDLREQVATDHLGRVERPSRELRAEVFDRFRHAVRPLREAGKLGGVLMQFPPYIVCKPSAEEYLEWAADELAGHEMLVEFRHRSWFDEGNTPNTLSLPRAAGRDPRDRGRAAHGRPQHRAHGGRHHLAPRRTCGCTGETPTPGTCAARSAAERFDHLYTEQELDEWVEPLRDLGAESEHVCAMFNNNGRSVDRRAGSHSPRRRSTRTCCRSCSSRAGVRRHPPDRWLVASARTRSGAGWRRRAGCRAR